MASKLLSPWKKWLGFGKPRPIRNAHARRCAGPGGWGIEPLEDRLVPATQLFDGLEFPDGRHVHHDEQRRDLSSNPVQVGVAPAAGTSVVPLLVLNGGVQYTATDTTGTFTTSGSVGGYAGGQPLNLLDAHEHTFTASGLLGSVIRN